MSDKYDAVYEVWAELAINAAYSTSPRDKLITLLLEFENGIYNRALNEVLLNLENNGCNCSSDTDIVKRMYLGISAPPTKYNTPPIDMIPAVET